MHNDSRDSRTQAAEERTRALEQEAAATWRTLSVLAVTSDARPISQQFAGPGKRRAAVDAVLRWASDPHYSTGVVAVYLHEEGRGLEVATVEQLRAEAAGRPDEQARERVYQEGLRDIERAGRS